MNALSFVSGLAPRCTQPGAARAAELAEAALEVGAGHDDEYVLAQFGHAVLQHVEQKADRAVLMNGVLEALAHSSLPTAGAMAVLAQRAASKKLETTSLEELQELALYEVLRSRHKPPAEVLADYGMRSDTCTPSWEDKARVCGAVLETVVTHGADVTAAKIAADARKKCFDRGLARGRATDASILMEAFPRILHHVRAQEVTAERRREQEVRQLAGAPAPAGKVKVEEGWVNLGGVRVPRR